MLYVSNFRWALLRCGKTALNIATYCKKTWSQKLAPPIIMFFNDVVSRIKRWRYINLEESWITRIQDGAAYFREHSVACKAASVRITDFKLWKICYNFVTIIEKAWVDGGRLGQGRLIGLIRSLINNRYRAWVLPTQSMFTLLLFLLFYIHTLH